MPICHPRTLLASAIASLALAGGALAAKPSISLASPLTIDEDTTNQSVALVLDDDNTAVASLALSVTNNTNPTLIPNSNVTFTGGSSRLVRVTPAADQFGTSSITIRALDGNGESETAVLVVNVTNVNDKPTISTNATRSMPEDGTRTWPITVGDIDSSVNSLTLRVSNNTNSSLIPNGNVSFGGTGANRTIQVTPRANDNGGPATLTIEVSDGDETETDTIAITVTQVNDPPSLSGSLSGVSDNVGSATIFSSLTLTDVDDGSPGAPASEEITATIVLQSDDLALGSLVELDLGDLTDPTTGDDIEITTSTTTRFVAEGPPAALTNIVRGQLGFTPTPNSIAVGTHSLDFDITLDDGVAPDTSATKSSTFTSVNDAIAASVAASTSAFEGSPLFPFASFGAEDEDLGEQAEITITFPAAGGSFAGGSPNFTGTVAAAIDHMRNLSFTPAGSNVTFSIAVRDVHPDGSKGTADNLSTTLSVTDVNRSPEIAGVTTALIRTGEGQGTALFSSVQVSDADGDLLTVTITFPRERGDLSSTGGRCRSPAPPIATAMCLLLR